MYFYLGNCRDKIMPTIGAVHRAPNTDFGSFNQNYSKLLSALSLKKNKCCITGDFNTNLLNYEMHSETALFLNEAFSQNLYPVITRPTRFSSSATLIDNIFVTSLIGNYLSCIFVNDISYHLPVFYIAQDKITVAFQTTLLKLIGILMMMLSHHLP